MSKVKFGLSNVYVAPRTETGGDVTYGAPVKIPGAVNCSISRESSQNIFYADNSAYFTSNSKSSVSLDLEIADVARDILKNYLGYIEAKEGGILETNSAVTPHFALLFQVETDEKARKFCYYDCSAVESDEEYSTEEESIDPTTSTLTITCTGEAVGDVKVFKQVVEANDANYATFFTSVKVPTAKTVGEMSANTFNKSVAA